MRGADDDHITDVTGVAPMFVSEEPTGRVGSSVRLVCVAGGVDLGRTFRLTRLPATIGRGTQVEVPLFGKDISRQHARISAMGKDFAIEDLGSVNGTYLNGAEIKGRATVRVGDRVQLGSTIFVFAHHDELEDRMHQLQRIEAMGSLAGGLAHDFNNALSVILGTLGLMERKLPAGSDVHAMLGEMKTAAASASALARRLLRLGRSEPLEFETVVLDSLVSRTVAMMRRQLPGVELVVKVGDGLAVRGSQEELHQVLVNLMLNARDAMPHGGTLTLSATSVTFDAGQAAAHHLPTKGDYVGLVLRDTGTGMDEATLARAFEPFFTTKPPGQGTGLGLAMIYSIVRRHGGAILGESRVGHGATFRIWLPSAV